jgi:2-polyprenyl-6-methoxyphenol hydroxylase-like FAD-dependent oxidoreductase
VVGVQNKTDIFIVGGGPAGLAAAIAASQIGLRITVADGALPPIEKPCGEGMMPSTLAALNSLGVALEHGDGHSFRGISFVQRDAAVTADFSHGLAIGLRRPVLHQRLVARAEACGVRLLWKTPVSGIALRIFMPDGSSERTVKARVCAVGSAWIRPDAAPCATQHAATIALSRGPAIWKFIGPAAPRLTSHRSPLTKSAS